MKYALRWRASGRWESQQAAEQKTSLILPELQVDTEQRMTLPPTAMGLRHIEQRNTGGDVMGRCLPQTGLFRCKRRLAETCAQPIDRGQYPRQAQQSFFQGALAGKIEEADADEHEE
jgi:hypothetical protein